MYVPHLAQKMCVCSVDVPLQCLDILKQFDSFLSASHWVKISAAHHHFYFHSANEVSCSWNNGKSGAKLDLTSLTTPGLQIRVIGCRVSMTHSCISATPHLGTSFPLFHGGTCNVCKVQTIWTSSRSSPNHTTVQLSAILQLVLPQTATV